MYEELVKRLRDISNSDSNIKSNYIGLAMNQAADAIEELSREYESIEESLTESVERVRKLKSPRWIPVTERLPEERDYYLAMTEDCEVWVCEYLPGVKQWWIVPSDDLILNITHWQKLPEPPKEEAP